MQNKLFELKNINKVFKDGTHALNNIDLTINNGVTVIIGPSGSGKSTMLRLLNLLELPNSGEIIYNNENILDENFDLKKHRSEVGMVFQNFHLFPHLSVLDNLNLAQIEVLNKDITDATTTSLKLLEQVGLIDKKNNYPNQLSGGQKQRIAIARSLAINPDVILFDEPTSALDPEMVKEVLLVMRDLKNAGLNMVIVTHEMQFAKVIADTVIVIDNGEIVEIDNPKVIFENPNNDRTKAFINSITLNLDDN